MPKSTKNKERVRYRAQTQARTRTQQSRARAAFFETRCKLLEEDLEQARHCIAQYEQMCVDMRAVIERNLLPEFHRKLRRDSKTKRRFTTHILKFLDLRVRQAPATPTNGNTSSSSNRINGGEGRPSLKKFRFAECELLCLTIRLPVITLFRPRFRKVPFSGPLSARQSARPGRRPGKVTCPRHYD